LKGSFKADVPKVAKEIEGFIGKELKAVTVLLLKA
jgi:hypothetical protein